MNEEKEFTLQQHSLPILSAGSYKIYVDQELTSPSAKKYPRVLKEIVVAYPQFNIPKEDIYLTYPMPSASGNYSDALPFIIFNKKTIPWELTLDNNSPWLALICLKEDEILNQSERTISELLATNSVEKDIYYPITSMPIGSIEKKENLCFTIDISYDTFKNIVPKLEELKYLAHVKNIDQYNKTDKIAQHDGRYSVVISSRFVPSDTKKPLKSWLHLVSLSGFKDVLNNTQSSKYKNIRMVSLHRWHIFSQSSDKPGFGETFENLNIDRLLVSDSSASNNPKNMKPFNMGYVPKLHILRTGEKTASLYRSPLIPYSNSDALNDNRPFRETYTSDGQITYDKSLGIFDMSYAAAWEIGRLLTLKNKAIAIDIFKWRRNIVAKQHRKQHSQLIKSRLDSVTEDKSLLDFMVNKLCNALAVDEIVSPISKNRGK